MSCGRRVPEPGKYLVAKDIPIRAGAQGIQKIFFLFGSEGVVEIAF
jgi:hypothetical protein